MQKKIIFSLCILVFGAFFEKTALAYKQKYQRHYQKKEAFFQKKTPKFQKKDLPDAGSYFEVSRKMPKVTLEYQPKEPVFNVSSSSVLCNGQNTFSCTLTDVDFTSATDCEQSHVDLKVLEPKGIVVEISSVYPKETCQFNQILKHELTHVSLYKKSLNEFINQSQQMLKTEYTAGQRASKGCEYIQKKIFDLTAGLKARFEQTMQEKNKKIDFENGVHKYELQVCDQPEQKNE